MINSFKFLLPVLFSFSSMAYADEIICPPAILASTTVSTADGWEAVGGAAEYKLEHAQLYSGHPSDEMPLTPEERADGKTLTARWRLKLDGEQEYWVGCAYHNTTVVLARKLDSRVRLCTVRYPAENDAEPGQRGVRPLELSCT
jgi:hypothetical protein